jgi:acetylornithine/succinyldiaminopimelate/putrescine aminotransferase
MLAVELKVRAGGYLSALAERGVLALSTGSNGIRFLPPLVIGAEEVDTVVQQVAGVLGEAAHG